jgi:hypothetical protein
MKYARQHISLAEKVMLNVQRCLIEKALQFVFTSRPDAIRVLDIGCGNQPLKNSVVSAGHTRYGLVKGWKKSVYQQSRKK